MRSDLFSMMTMLFLVLESAAEEPGRLLPASKKSIEPRAPLFSVSGIGLHDSGAASATHLKIKSPIDTLKASVLQKAAASVSITGKETIKKRDTVPANSVTVPPRPQTLSTVPDTLKTLAVAALPKDSSRNVKLKPSPQLSPRDKQDPANQSSLGSSQLEVKKNTPAGNPNERGHGNGKLFDLRYVILLLSIIILGFFLRYALKRANRPTFVTTTRLSIMDKEVQTACRYIEKNYKNQQLSLETVCEALVTGKAFLDALFHQELGLSVEDFITHVRINRARMLIEKSPSVNADAAALETGFNDTNSFLNAFSSIIGLPFDEYRVVRAKNVA